MEMKMHTQLMNLPVVDRATGLTEGYMRGVVCAPGHRRIDGIVYEERGLLRRCQYVPWSAVAAMGDHSIVIDGTKRHRSGKKVECTNVDSRVFSADGRFLGRISNYLIDERSGNILGMELSASVMDDLKNGRKIIENRGNLLQNENSFILTDGADADSGPSQERRADDEGVF